MAWPLDFLGKGSIAQVEFRCAGTCIGTCIGDIGRDYEDIDGDAAFCARALSASADAAERLAKGMLCRLKVDYDFTHDLAELAKQARSQGHRNEAQAIASLNGKTKRDHAMSYRESPPGPQACAHAADRLARTINLLRDEVDCHARQALPPERAERLRSAIEGHFSLARGHLENAALRSHAEDESASSRASVDAMVSKVEDVIDAIDEVIGKGPDHKGRADTTVIQVARKGWSWLVRTLNCPPQMR